MEKETDRLQSDVNDEFQILPTGYKVNIEFNDLTYQVPDSKQGFKTILKNINGHFHANELTAIMGTSGSGKTTLLNLLAGYRINKTSGTVNVNGKTRRMNVFSKMSRYIMQEDHVSPYFTVMESMMFAAKFKLDTHLSDVHHVHEINKILDVLHLSRKADTRVIYLSGGEKKRLCIALELLNIPTVIFLDEPTTGLDEFSAAKCIKLLKCLVKSGRTIICSIHTPSARLFKMFDHVYVMAEGQCVYQGSTTNIIPYLTNFGLNCPVTYNPADFIIEVAAREYGDYHDNLVHKIKNGKIYKWQPIIEGDKTQIDYLKPKMVEEFELEKNMNVFCRNSSRMHEYKILSKHMLIQMWRDKNYLKLKIIIKLFSAFCIGAVYTGMGGDGKRFYYNLHLSFLVMTMCIYFSMFPMLSHLPLEMNYLRKEHFNQWYRLSSYFMALLTAQTLDIFILSFVCSACVYFMTDQPVELHRFLLFVLVAQLTSMISSSFAMAVSSRLNLVHSLFFAPYIASCWTLFAHHSIGNPKDSLLDKLATYSSFCRHSVEGMMSALLSFNRSDPICPPNEIFCPFQKPKYLLKLTGFENVNYIQTVISLIGFYVFFNIVAFIHFKWRLGSLKYLQQNRFYQHLKMCIWKYFLCKL